MAITFVGAGAVATGANPAVAVPAGIAAGDLLLITVTSGGGSSAITGWTRSINQGSNRQLTVYSRVATASETSPVTVPNGNNGTKAVMVAYRGSTGSIINISSFNSATSTAPSTNSVTTTFNNMTVVSLYGTNNNVINTFTAPASTTSRVNSGSTTSVNGLLLVDEIKATAGATTARTATLGSSDSWSTVAFTLQEVVTVYWVGGTGTWNTASTTNWSLTSGGASGAAAPTSIDNVVIDANSGTGTITCTAGVCNDLTVTASQAIVLGATSSTLSVYGNLTLPSGGSFSANTNTWTITFASTTTGETITTNGKSFSSVTFNGVGGGWTLGSDLTCAASLNLTNGTLDTSATNNYSITALSLPLVSGTKTLNLNASTVNLFGTAPIQWQTNGTNFTFNAGTSSVNLSASSADINTGGFTFYDVSFTNTGLSTGNITNASSTFNNLTFTSRASDGISNISLSGNVVVNGTLTLGASNTAVRRLFVFSNSSGTPRTITAAAIATLTDIDFRDITAAGASGTWSGTRLGDCLSTTNITFDAGKTVYWNLTGSQSWAAVGWASSSGGTPALNNFPLAQDTAIFDNAGTATTVATTSNWNIGTIDMSTRTTAFTFNLNSNTNHYGSLILFSGLTLGSGGTTSFVGRSAVTQTLTTAGVTFGNTISISGSVILGSDLASTGQVTFSSGTFNANNYNVTIGTFSSTVGNVRTITMGSGLWTLTSASTCWNLSNITNLTFNKNTANILLSNTTTSGRFFQGGGLTYNKLTIGGATGISDTAIQGVNTFSELASTKTVAHSIRFDANQTITTWSVTGTAGNVVTISSTTTGTQRLLTIANKITTADYLALQDINSVTINPVVFWAGANSTDNGNNTNIVFADGTTASAYVLTSGTSFTTPADWNNTSNSIYLIGGGGGGAGSVNNTTTSARAAGAGGGGGGYRLLTNQTLSGTITYAIGAAGSAGTGSSAAGARSSTAGTGGTTTWNTTNTATGGAGGVSNTVGPASTGGTGGTGTYTGGTGGAGATFTGAQIVAGGGGGGAAGVNGNGAAGGTGNTNATNANGSAGGGGGNGGGSAGGNGVTGTSGAGGNNSSSTGGGTSVNDANGAAGTVGGGGSGAEGTGFRGGIGGRGVEVLGTFGSGGGSGGSTNSSNANATPGLYGAGGGGAGSTATSYNGAAGAQGAIILVYALSTTYNDSITENTNLADVLSALGLFNSAAIENTDVDNTQSSQSIFNATNTENTAVADSSSPILVFNSAVTEPSTIASIQAGTSVYNSAIAEAIAAADASSATKAFLVSIVENQTVAASQSATVIFSAIRIENLVIDETQDSPGNVYYVTSIEGTRASDLNTAQVNYSSTSVEAFSVADIQATFKFLNSDIVENSELSDSSTRTAIFASDIVEGTSVETIAQVQGIFASFVTEALTVSDLMVGYGWFRVVDAQTVVWTGVDDGQTVTWTNVSDTQTPNWVIINDNQG